MRRDGSISEVACFGLIVGVVSLLVLAFVDMCLMRGDGPPVSGVVIGQGFTPGQTSFGTVTNSDGTVGTTVSRSEDVYTVVVQTEGRKEAIRVRRRVWESLKDGQPVYVRRMVSPIFGFRESRLAD